ncbi:type II toxin-antitoxin system RelE family toxin [Leptotrichia hofstadii]|uniref:type II toxin-antitoxin system RelE family toxin n=1 Tax=Leptotrichia hofstadii TaxID=157688 RepID=UPI002F967170
MKEYIKIGQKSQKQIKTYIKEIIEKLENPRSQGKALQGKYKGKWRYRVENYRILAIIIDEKITIYIFDIGHRKEIYK